MNNNVGANGLDRHHGGLSQHQDQGPQGGPGQGKPKQSYVPPHLRGRGGGDVPPRFENERSNYGGGGGGRGGFRGGDRHGQWDENRGAYRRDDRQGGGHRGRLLLIEYHGQTDDIIH